MKVKYFPANGAMETREVKTFTDIQTLVGGWVEMIHWNQPSSEFYLVDEEARLKQGTPRNEHFPAFFGPVVVAGSGWETLPYG